MPRIRSSGAGTEDDPIFFERVQDFRAWLQRHHLAQGEAWVGYYKKHSGKPTIDWPLAVDVALCFGWIDGIRKSIDNTSFKQRFTPRRRGSNWSTKNINRMHELIAEGLVTPAGIEAFEARRADRSGIYSFEREEPATLPAEYEAELRANARAASFWDAQPPGYRRIATHWVLSAKQEATRQRRLRQLIDDAAAGLRIAMLRREPRR